MPKDVAIIRQIDICKLTNKPITDCEDTAKIMGYILKNKIRGYINE